MNEKDATIAALEESLTLATDTMEQNAAELQRLHQIIRSHELHLHHLQSSTSERIAPIERQSSRIVSDSIGFEANITTQDLQKVPVNLKYDANDGNLSMIEFENTHLKEKLAKVLNTVDILNDEIASLQDTAAEKDREIRRLANEVQRLNDKMNGASLSLSPLNTAMKSASIRQQGMRPEEEEEEQEMKPAVHKRIWGAMSLKK